MSEIPKSQGATQGGQASGGLRARRWKRFLRGPDQMLLEELYVPALSEAIRYDRCCSYFSSTVLAAAARGFGRLIERLLAMGNSAPRPAVRLVVNEELAAEDVRAMMETGDLSKLEAALLRRFKTPREALEKQRLAMLGWLVKRGLLEVRVAVMRSGEGICHAKFGIMTDAAGDAVVFAGSGNESATGLQANYERLEISTSWEDPERHQEYAREFADLWGDMHPDVHTVSLPEALRLKLVKFAPQEAPITEPSTALARQKAAMLWQFIVEAPYLENGGPACDATAPVDLWPHQRRVVEEVAGAWPEGRLLCDEVGMGKTIEAILILRRLMAGRGVRRVLILLPAGLLEQWQGEFREKGGMLFPRLQGTTALVWPDDRIEKVDGLAQALERDALLMSRETARTENNIPILLAARPWDLVVLDEAHAARRREQKEGEFNRGTLLLDLLRQLQLRRKARGFLLISATPMQTHPWEPWDLLAVLGEGGRWLADFAGVRDFYNAIAAVRNGTCDLPTARKAAAMIISDPRFPKMEEARPENVDLHGVARRIAFALPSKRQATAQWLLQGSPLTRRMHRNTRKTLQRYFEMGLLPDPPPEREVKDEFFDYEDPAERRAYEAVEEYIEKRYNEIESEKPGKGFVMTVYRRRASSSPFAIMESLRRRSEGLQRVAERKAYDETVSAQDMPDRIESGDVLDDVDVRRISSALPTDPKVARAELEEVNRLLDRLRNLGARDSKRDKFFDVLRQITDDGRRVLVFTEYKDTLTYLRDNLIDHYGKALACYSGDGGELWDGKPVTKDVITEALQQGQLKVLICTDAASEGLNLQAAGAVINYDLPWNPCKVEQRIGRIDRIGQKARVVRVVNLFLKHSVDEQVYTVLKERCGLFKHFVGPMQPVLARARGMLLGQEPANLGVIKTFADEVEQDPLAVETYVESEAHPSPEPCAAVTRDQLAKALECLNGDFGFRVKCDASTGRYAVTGTGFSKAIFSCKVEELERDRTILPLSPLEPRLRHLVDLLLRPGERLPLVIGSYEKGGFRASVAYWLGGPKPTPLASFDDLNQKVQAWDGTYPCAEERLKALKKAQAEARERVRLMEVQAEKREREGLQRQREAARLRLLRELGRYLICLGGKTTNLNEFWYTHGAREIASAQRLKRCYDRLGGYPDWDSELLEELNAFAQQLTENQRRARIAGSEVDAALDDPRWAAKVD